MIFVLSFLLQLWLPWWIVMAVPFLLCLWKSRTAGGAFLTSFLAIFSQWLITALFIHVRSGGIMSQRVADLLQIGSPALLLLVSALAGGLAAGLAGWAGRECRNLVLS